MNAVNVKKFMLWMLVVLAWAAPVLALETNLMMHTDGEYLYIIKFVYDTNAYTVPATYPQGPPHYDAEITVSEVRSNAVIEVCPPWRGYYTARKCYEDEPAAVVRQALGRRWKRRAGNKQEPRLTEKTMVALGFARIGRRRGKGGYWARNCGGNNGIVVTRVRQCGLRHQTPARPVPVTKGCYERKA